MCVRVYRERGVRGECGERMSRRASERLDDGRRRVAAPRFVKRAPFFFLCKHLFLVSRCLRDRSNDVLRTRRARTGRSPCRRFGRRLEQTQACVEEMHSKRVRNEGEVLVEGVRRIRRVDSKRGWHGGGEAAQSKREA